MIEELTATRTEVARLRTRLNEALAENERLEYVLDKRNAQYDPNEVYEIRVQIDQKVYAQGTIEEIVRKAWREGYERGQEDVGIAARAWLAQRGAGLPEVWRRELSEALGVDTAQEAP